MRLAPEDALFGERPVPPRGVAARALLLCAALGLNAELSSPAPLLLLALAGLAATAIDRRGHSRAGLLLLGAASFVAVAVALRIATGSAAGLAPLVLRLSAGLAWTLWFGGAVPWPALRAFARRCGAPEEAVSLVDAGVAHGLLLLRELARRDEAVAVRLGLARRRDRFAYCGEVLAGGVTRAFDRAVVLEEARLLREGGGASAEPGPALDLRDASAAYPDGSTRLHAITLQLGRAGWLAVAGPSGSGKTTLLRLCAGLLPPRGGSVRRFGVDLREGPARQRLDPRVGLIFQDPDDQLLGSTPLEDLAWGLRRRGVAEAEALDRARRMLAALRVEHLAERAVHGLSFGEKKRIAFGAVLVCEPELLLCDEPTIGLDPVAARTLVELVVRAARPRSTAVVWVTHDLDALPAPVDRVVLLAGGRAVFDGPRAEALSAGRLRDAGLAWDDQRDGATIGDDQGAGAPERVDGERCSNG